MTPALQLAREAAIEAGTSGPSNPDPMTKPGCVQSALLAIQRRDAEIVAWLRDRATRERIGSNERRGLQFAADAIERESGNG